MIRQNDTEQSLDGSVSSADHRTEGSVLPLITLPTMVPKQRVRDSQSDIPNDRQLRDRLKQLAADYVEQKMLVGPLPMAELRDHAIAMMQAVDISQSFREYAAVLINNAVWRDTLAQVPYDRRLLLMPKCLRIEELCPAPFDEFGLLCKQCGLCSIQDLQAEAERLGYAVLVAEGSAIVMKIVESGKIEAIVGVSCLNVLEKSFPFMESAAIPGVAIPLLQDDCVDTSVDIDWVWDVIHLTSQDQTYRLDMDALRQDVQSWFTPSSLTQIMGQVDGETEQISRDWLGRAGKRWRPFLTTCTYMAIKGDAVDTTQNMPLDLKKLAVAVECFHKASLIHDDIEDGDAERYGEPALHEEYGIPVALNVGDLLLGEGYRLIGEIEASKEIAKELLRTTAHGHRTLSQGQGAELCWASKRKPLSTLEVLDMFRRKTAPAFEVALRVGAAYAGADQQTLAVLSEYSESLGIAYQITDDLDDYTGQGDSNDIRDMRPSVLLAIAHKRATDDDKKMIAAIWTGTQRYEDHVASIETVFNTCDVVQKTQDLLEAYKEQAIRSLRPLTNATLKGLLRRVVAKIFGHQLIEGYCDEYETRNAASREVGTKAAG